MARLGLPPRPASLAEGAVKEAVGVAVVGLGYWGPNLARNFSEIEGFALRRAVDLDLARAERVARRTPGARACARIEDALSDPAVAAVAIATPAATHAKLGRQTLEAGKHLLIEKPMAFSAAEARALEALAAERGLALLVGHTYEHNPAVHALRDAMREAAFGRPRYVYTTRVNLGRFREDVNVLWNLAPHDISILLYVLGESPSSVAARGKAFLQPGIEDVAFLYLEFPSGAVAHVHVSWLDPSKVRRVTVVGEGRMAVFDDLDNEAKVRLYDRGAETVLARDGGPRDYEARLRAGDIRIPRIDRTEPLRAECEHFLACIRGEAPPRAGAAAGRRVVEVLEAAQRSLESGGAAVALADGR